MLKMKVTLVVLLLLLPSATPAALAKGSDKNKNAAADINYETRVYVRDKCVVNPRPQQAEFIGALAGIFLPVLIEKLLGGLGGALKKAGDPEKLQDSGRLPTYLYQLTSVNAKNVLRINPELGCVLVVRGMFAGAPATIENADEANRIQRLRDARIPVSEIAVLYEAEIMLSDDGTALRYEGRFFEINKFQGGRSPKQPRAVVLGLSITGAGDKEGEPVLSLALTNVGQVAAGTVMNADQLTSRRSSWLGGLAISDASLKAIETIKFPDPNNPSRPFGIMPVTIEGTITETDDGNKALKFIGDILDATKGDVAKTVSGEITKDRGAEAKKKAGEAADALEKLRQEEESTYSELLKAESDLAANPLPAGADQAQQAAHKVKEFEVEKAIRAWCVKTQALRNIGKAPDRGRTCP
jgi:hypothetical protein